MTPHRFHPYQRTDQTNAASNSQSGTTPIRAVRTGGNMPQTMATTSSTNTQPAFISAQDNSFLNTLIVPMDPENITINQLDATLLNLVNEDVARVENLTSIEQDALRASLEPVASTSTAMGYVFDFNDIDWSQGAQSPAQDEDLNQGLHTPVVCLSPAPQPCVNDAQENLNTVAASLPSKILIPDLSLTPKKRQAYTGKELGLSSSNSLISSLLEKKLTEIPFQQLEDIEIDCSQLSLSPEETNTLKTYINNHVDISSKKCALAVYALLNNVSFSSVAVSFNYPNIELARLVYLYNQGGFEYLMRSGSVTYKSINEHSAYIVNKVTTTPSLSPENLLQHLFAKNIFPTVRAVTNLLFDNGIKFNPQTQRWENSNPNLNPAQRRQTSPLPLQPAAPVSDITIPSVAALTSAANLCFERSDLTQNENVAPTTTSTIVFSPPALVANATISQVAATNPQVVIASTSRLQPQEDGKLTLDVAKKILTLTEFPHSKAGIKIYLNINFSNPATELEQSVNDVKIAHAKKRAVLIALVKRGFDADQVADCFNSSRTQLRQWLRIIDKDGISPLLNLYEMPKKLKNSRVLLEELKTELLKDEWIPQRTHLQWLETKGIYLEHAALSKIISRELNLRFNPLTKRYQSITGEAPD